VRGEQHAPTTIHPTFPTQTYGQLSSQSSAAPTLQINHPHACKRIITIILSAHIITPTWQTGVIVKQ
jgi:hypothetical protein